MVIQNNPEPDFKWWTCIKGGHICGWLRLWEKCWACEREKQAQTTEQNDDG